jgi:putative intracellular protease/amidase
MEPFTQSAAKDRQILMVVSCLQETGVAGPGGDGLPPLAPEATAFWERLTSAGASVTVASTSEASLPRADAGRAAEHPGLDRFGAVFIVDGDGATVDLARNPHLARVITELHSRGGVIATQGYGAAALLSAPARSDGQWLFDGYRMTALTDEEKSHAELGSPSPAWSLETALKQAGAIFDDGGTAWRSHVVVDRNLITGQNPQSADAVADAILTHLEVL